MTRDDSSGGWVPLSGGGLANVSVRRRPASSGGHQSNNTNGSGISTTTASTTNTTQSVSTTSVTNTQNHGSSNSSPPGATKKRHEYLIYGKRITDQSVIIVFINHFSTLLITYDAKLSFLYRLFLAVQLKKILNIIR